MREIDISVMRSRFSYSPEFGTLRHRHGTKRKGSIAGFLDSEGYMRVRVKGVDYRAHRVAWALHFNEQPPEIIDHVNSNRSDNRIGNLRAATAEQNARHKQRCRTKKSSNFKGVYKTPIGRFVAAITHDRVRYIIGTYQSEEEAASAYKDAAIELWGEFA